MSKSLEKEFLSFCENQDLEVNKKQITVIKKLEEYYQINFKSFLSKLFSKKLSQKCFSQKQLYCIFFKGVKEIFFFANINLIIILIFKLGCWSSIRICLCLKPYIFISRLISSPSQNLIETKEIKCLQHRSNLVINMC